MAVSVRCGASVATYLRLGHLSARRGARVGVGAPLGTLGPAGLLRLGARRASDRRGYVDPLSLLRDPRPTAPRVLATPRPQHPPVPHPARPRVRVAPRAARGPAAGPRPAAPDAPPHAPTLPWLAYPALALVASALPLGGLVHRRRRRTRSPAPATAERA
jgi:hypothetical protein